MIENIDQANFTNNQILKQSLIEFHNAMSHLEAVYRQNQNDEKNINRAINHFKRGALDSYKAIIKDFFVIFKDKSSIQKYIQQVRHIREQEYRDIESDKDILNDYKNLTNSLIEYIATK